MPRSGSRVRVSFPAPIFHRTNGGYHFQDNQSCQHGALAKRLCSGLQIRLVRFDSGTCLHIDKPVRGLDTDCGARVVKSVDTRDLKSLDVRVVPVRFRPRAPLKLKKKALQIKQIRRFIASFLFLLPSVSPLSLFLSCPFLV